MVQARRELQAYIRCSFGCAGLMAEGEQVAVLSLFYEDTQISTKLLSLGKILELIEDYKFRNIMISGQR